MNTLIILAGLVLSFQAVALELPKPQPASPHDHAALEKAIRVSFNGSIQNVTCKHTFSISTGGNMNYAVAGICYLDDKESQLSCVDVMTGTIGSSVRLHPEQPLQQELLDLVRQSCVGG